MAGLCVPLTSRRAAAGIAYGLSSLFLEIRVFTSSRLSQHYIVFVKFLQFFCKFTGS